MPEYAFLEPRGMGIYDGKDAAAVLPEVSVRVFTLESACVRPLGNGEGQGREWSSLGFSYAHVWG